MNIERIESILYKAPAPLAPEELLRQLTAGIRLPRAAVSETISWNQRSTWMRRWLPALSFATIFLVCVAVIAVQTNVLSGLQQENGQLQAAGGKLDTLRAQNAEYQRLATENQELERLRKDNAEMLKLRAELTQLKSLLQDGEKLRAQNRQLLTQANPGGAAGEDFFAQEKAEAERIHCVNNLKQIGLAARLWAQDNHDVYPTNFICMTNELSTWIILQCPSDKAHNVSNWAEVTAGNISYIMDAPGGLETEPQVVFVECPVHHAVCLMDGSVQSLNEAAYQKHIKLVDGKKTYVP